MNKLYHTFRNWYHRQRIKLIRLLGKFYNKPSIIKNSKFIAIKFQTINGIGLILGLCISWLY